LLNLKLTYPLGQRLDNIIERALQLGVGLGF
jgi:hypothetical protein